MRNVRSIISSVMDSNEAAIRSIKDAIASALGSIDEASSEPGTKENIYKLHSAAISLKRSVYELEGIINKLRSKG
jgi:hypothetical protein